MNEQAARSIVLDALRRIAPELDVTELDAGAELQAEVDLDSMDFLTLVEQVSTAISHDIPERDYPQLLTVDALVAYVVAATSPA